MRIIKRMIDSSEIQQEAIINFKKGSWVNKAQKHAIEGAIPVRLGSDKNYVIGGTWCDGITILNQETEQEFELWKPIPLPENSAWNQNFTRMTL